MDLKKYLSFDGLTQYDSLIKARIDEELFDKQNKDLIVEFADSDNKTVTKSVAEIASAAESGTHVKFFDGGEYLDLLGCSVEDNFAIFYTAYCINGEWSVKSCAIVGSNVVENATEKFNYAAKEDVVQSDLSQNDETALDYVKNRTHWVEDDGETYHPLDEKFIPETIASKDYVKSLVKSLNSNRVLRFYCIEDVTIVNNGVSVTYPANSDVEVKFLDTDVYEIIPTSNNSIMALNAFPGALGTYYPWLEGVKQFSNILFDMNAEEFYSKWSQGNQSAYQVQFAQYTNCIFWSDNPYISDVNKRTNYTLYYTSQLPLCYSNIPDNTFKAFFLAFNVNSDPNWGNQAYRDSFAKATWATQAFSYYGARTIGIFGHDDPDFNIVLPKDCRGLMYASTAIENAGTFDAINTTTFGASSGSWRDAFGWCSSLRNLYIKNLKVNLNISWSPINYDSIYFIISEAANTNKITISVSPYTYNLLGESDFELAASKNITIELLTTNYVEDRRLNAIANKADKTDIVNADWNQNDGTALDYIKNRTHWVEDDGETYHSLDEKFIPDTIARKSELDNLGLITIDDIDDICGSDVIIGGGDVNSVGSDIEPAEDDIPKVFFGGALPQAKIDSVMPFRYISKTQDISGYCVTKAQGSSSMNWPKKNQTVKLYKDSACTEKMKVDFKGWGKQNKFCFKANWIDISHARNIVSARLWGDVVESRANYAELPELLRTSPNQGAVDGFPVKVYANGVYQGRYTLNIPKDAWMANMDDELDTHCILCGEDNANDSSLFRVAANIDETDWSDEIHDTVPASIKTRWNEVISFVANSTDENFRANLGNYFDVPSLIDYYLFGLATCGHDAFGKNQLYMTYDGQKWIATMYDMDSTWGLWWTGASFVPTDYARTDFQDFKDGSGNLLYIRLESLFIDEIKARWEELKNGALSAENIINHFERFTDICPPWLVAEDYAETTVNGSFAEIPSQTTNNIQQIRKFVVERLAYTDEVVQKFGAVDETILYSLPNETTFDGVDDWINTGLKLGTEYKTYTVFADLTSDENPVLASAFCCMNESGGGGFVVFNGAENVMVPAGGLISGSDAQGVVKIPHNVRGKIAIRVDNAKTYGITYASGDSGYADYTGANGAGCGVDNGYIQLRIGCAQDTSYNNWRFWKGTMHNFKVWNRVLSDEEVHALF